MAILFIETPDATQALEFWSGSDGTVAYDSTLTTKSGVASWKCDSGAGNDATNLEGDSNSANRRCSFYVNFTHLPAATVRFFVINNTEVSLRITSGGVLQLYDKDSVQAGSNGSTLSTSTWYRITVANSSGSTANITVYLDGISDIDTDSVAGAVGPYTIGWADSPGANKIMNFQHVYIDDVADESDTGDVRVTAKLPTNTGGTSDFDTVISSLTFNDRPISESTGAHHAADTDVVESSDIEAVGVGDVNITGATLLGHAGWVWAKDGSGSNGTPKIIVNDVETTVALTTATTLFVDVNTSTSYPSGGTNEIGMRSTGAGADTFWYEGGVLIAYIQPLVAGSGSGAVFII